MPTAIRSSAGCRRQRPATAALLGALLILAGCGVPEQVVRDKDTELAACQSRLAACETAMTACESEARRRGAELEARAERDALNRAALDEGNAQLAALRDELDECLRKAQAVQATASTLEQREAELRARLATELASRDVEIERLRDRLSVRMLDRILFDTGSAVIRTEGRAVLDKLGPVLAEGSEYVRIEGHTDDVPIGTALQAKYPSNWELAGARAASVVRWLQERHAVAPTRMEAVGNSFYRPLAPNDSAENRQRNRRVEIVLTAPPGG